ncbi:hypothetical protein ABB37_00593 [Leptomonas pyrrhocoris]|uniref:tRNA N(3)-methylcytidine methyltransferase n=1 Tax=Leptomonas pyrrhocoris TaxID=157538 RepID=A0A0M9GAQ1_LEPPY|nr:hypothetical protein ABB37_00593 [Leptomonas pyrrhocoris]KPA86420.1 hypothetical protein ABB37_00593 [Leptomonas pyrrhocoris]|eukprot:XP_015664859.1 hypothetical protein ABB37_00593 [Leptomonas pyrrhocoris]
MSFRETTAETGDGSSTSSLAFATSEGGSRKRGRSPPGKPYVSDYRPYGSGLLQLHRRRPNAEMHKKQWDLYYRNNTVNGYKDRHYILREFHELRAAIDAAAETAVGADTTVPEGGADKDAEAVASDGAASFSWMEAGCGVGNAMLPVFQEYGHLPQWRALLGFDISSVAIRLLEEKIASMPPALAAKVHVCVLNPSESDVADCALFHPAPACSSLSAATAAPRAFPEFVSLIFVLCSVPVPSHAVVLQRLAKCMKRPGGVLYFRDYAVSDHAESRFQQSNRQLRGESGNGVAAADANTYERTNGTLSHFFSVDEVRQLFTGAGFEVIALGIIESDVTNRKTSASFARKFVQGRFRLLA